MHFLTEDDIRARCPNPGCSLTLAVNERLTPAAMEFAAQMRVTVTREGNASPKPATPATAAAHATTAATPPGTCSPYASDAGPCDAAMTCLDADSLVSKGHPRIMLRGKLDTLLAATVLVQTQFDPKSRLSPYLKECLADFANWVLCTLSAEVSGSPCAACCIGGMDASVLHEISRDPKKYLGLEPFVPGVSIGANAALLNWLRAQVRETEVAAVQSGLDRKDIAASLNRLSSAAYVLVLLTLAAENGMDIAKIRQK